MRGAREVFQVWERRVCRAPRPPRSTQGHVGRRASDEQLLALRPVELASQHGRWSHGRATALLRVEGWQVSHKRVERLWRQEGLKVPAKQHKSDCLLLQDGSCLRLKLHFPVHARAMTSWLGGPLWARVLDVVRAGRVHPGVPSRPGVAGSWPQGRSGLPPGAVLSSRGADLDLIGQCIGVHRPESARLVS